MSDERICIFCKHFYFEEATPGYSEYTPGCDHYSVGCEKEYWEIDPYEDTRETYGQKLLTAKSCKDWEERCTKNQN